ncbi:hypothetical protein EDD11_009595 [Mortierella claussenii]|nr:hypothetical protein EDD11_009595 [Mortierella claussenii]
MRVFSSATTTSASLVALASLAGLLSLAPTPVLADLTCTQFGTDTFRVGSTIKFQWNDTQSVAIDTFNLNLYCVQSQKLIQTITSLNQTSPSPVPWIVNSTLASYAADCSLNQYQGAFDWTYSDPDTGAPRQGSAKCKVMLFVGQGAQAPMPGSSPNPSDPNNPNSGVDDPQPTQIEITDKTKSIVIGVGCAVGALVFAGFVGFYVIRYSNRRAEEENAARKLREPIQSAPLFPPLDRSNNGSASRAARYNELASVASASVTMGSPATTAARTEMVDLSAPTKAYASHHLMASPVLGSRSPTPIAAAHAKLGGGSSSSNSSLYGGGSPYISGSDRPGSLLTSSFVPSDENTRPSSPHKNPFEKQQYEQELHLQQQQHHQLQQQQQQQDYASYQY